MRRIKISPAVVIASLALVVASSGTAYAAATIGTNEIKDGSIRGIDVMNGTLNTKDLSQSAIGSLGNRWLLVDKDGAIIAQSGGFSINAAYPTLDNSTPGGVPDNSMRAAGNVYINANENLSNNAISVTIALQNVTEQDDNANTNGRKAGPDANAEFSGEITSTVCGITGIVGCAPPGANNRNHFVVSPRLSDGSVTSAVNHKRFYVVISGDSSDFISPATPILPKALS
ncbi:hypothetical protein J2X11_001448 [Aeromicrobium panaciterrae]|uniref:Uncharacterized protein n=1 Tax=Aeromicrobium panaciterrae TaxID=363861 RepID=A0ABU1UN43_9ACTN|nr:hypothetical protein [Aeromicrobium panaciterrae]MDR7086609.1 hypothetical protein [Aeromicrobium panaciterrae]